MQTTIDLPVARYRLECAAETHVLLPAFAGSTLRGAFGKKLRQGLCVTRARSCEACTLYDGCAYTAIFEPRVLEGDSEARQVPRPYVVEPPAWGERTYAPGERFVFHLVLAGQAIDKLALVLWAFDQALAGGVGKGNGRSRVFRVVHEGGGETEVLSAVQRKIAPHDTAIVLPAVETTRVTLHFDSPLRLQNNGRRATADEFTPRRLLTALMRRVSSMVRHHGRSGELQCDFTQLAALADTLDSEKDLRWRDWSRYSSRQQRAMDLGGVIGQWHLAGTVDPFLPFLHLGQWLHVGKEATFGLGGYRLEIH